MSDDDYEIIMAALSRQIQRALLSGRSEWSGPTMGPDQSADHIKTQSGKVRRLRELRSQIEEALTETEGMVKP